MLATVPVKKVGKEELAKPMLWDKDRRNVKLSNAIDCLSYYCMLVTSMLGDESRL